MSHQFRFSRARRTGVMLITGAALAAVPAAAQASAVNLGTAAPFVVLGGQSATNTGPSVLNGDLGVSPGTSLTGFGLPAVVNGATHNNDAVAAQAQSDLTTAYNVAAGQPVTTDLTGQDLGGLNLPAGAYHYSSSAQLTGQLTLDAAGDPNAQFVFEIGTTLTTASASSVRLINGASPCNVYWQVGSSATLDTTTDFAGTVMALASVTLNNGATVRGRMLARTGSVTLDNNVLDASMCNTPIAGPPTPTPAPTATPAPTTAPPGTTPPGTTPGAPGAPGSTPGAPGSGGQTPPASGTSVPTRKGTARLYPGGPLAPCTTGFRARVRGHMIKRVIFTIAGKRIATRRGSGFRVYVRPEVGKRGTLKAHVTFKDATRHMTRTFHYRACAAQVLRPALGPSQFTG